jgi:hypothetical protein
MMSQDTDGRYAAIEPTERLKALRDIKQGENLTDDDVEMFGEPDTATDPAKRRASK